MACYGDNFTFLYVDNDLTGNTLMGLHGLFPFTSTTPCGSVVVRVDVLSYSVTTMEKNNFEQGYANKFCVKLDDSATDAYGRDSESVW
jgi:hypothetical protein